MVGVGGIPMNAFAAPAAAGAAGYGSAAIDQPAVRIRQKFPETWLWDSVDSGYDSYQTKY